MHASRFGLWSQTPEDTNPSTLKRQPHQRDSPIQAASAERFRLPVIMVLMFASGFAGLVYQVLWMKQLGLLFGNTSHAAGATLAAFFAGLAVGSWFWGKRSGQCRNQLRIYAGLELGIAITALLYFVVMKGYHVIYPEVYQSVHSGA